jgi:hypothetical protein
LLPPSELGFRPHAGEFYIRKAELSPSVEDIQVCWGDSDPKCIAGVDDDYFESLGRMLVSKEVGVENFPTRLRLWQLFFAHRDYFWRLGVCIPGGDPANWGKEKYPHNPNEL